MIVRPLEAQEWPLVQHIFESEGGTMPQPECAVIIAAFDEDGSLAGFWTVQTVHHAGPLWIAPGHRGTGLWRLLHQVLCETFRHYGGEGFYSFSGQPKVEEIFRRLGYIDLHYKVWKKELT